MDLDENFHIGLLGPVFDMFRYAVENSFYDEKIKYTLYTSFEYSELVNPEESYCVNFHRCLTPFSECYYYKKTSSSDDFWGTQKFVVLVRESNYESDVKKFKEDLKSKSLDETEVSYIIIVLGSTKQKNILSFDGNSTMRNVETFIKLILWMIHDKLFTSTDPEMIELKNFALEWIERANRPPSPVDPSSFKKLNFTKIKFGSNQKI